MKRKSFVLSWGRKMFFGLGWLFTSLVALTYLQSMIIPQSIETWSFFVVNFIGHYGLILSAVYFLIYCPVLIIFPNYYAARIWSILLILFLNILIFIDSYLFVQYRFHLNSFLFKLLSDPEFLIKTGFTPIKLGVVGVIAFIFAVFFWLRGEKLWRSMQARFSNPVSNWYIVLIVVCFLGGQAMQIRSEAKGKQSIQQIAQLFPLSIPLYTAEASYDFSPEPLGYKDFNYPDEINCSMKKNKNVLLITLGQWSSDEISEEITPNISHYSSHGILFKNHFSGGMNKTDGFFSLLYSLSPNYATSIKNQKIEPLFMSELRKVKFDFSFYKNGAETPAMDFLPQEREIESDYIESTLADMSERDLVGSFFMQAFLDSGSLSDKDNQVKVILESFSRSDLMKNTIVILTGAYSVKGKTPLMVIWPGRRASVVNKITTHYDVFPTIMQEDWKCKTEMSKFSMGKNLFSEDARTSVIRGSHQHLELINFDNQSKTIIEPRYGLIVKNFESQQEKNDVDTKFVLDSLKEMATFYKR